MKKGIAVTALVVIAIVIIGLILIIANKDRLVNMAVGRAVDSIETAMMESEELPVSKEQAKQIFEKTRAKIKAGEMSAERATEIINRFREFYEDKKLDSEEVRKLLETLEKTVQ